MFHITEDGPKPCSAEKGRCPYARAGSEHFSNEADALKFYEDGMAKSYGILSQVKGQKVKPAPAKKKLTQPPAARVLQKFNQEPSDKNSFVNAYQSRLTTVSQEDRKRILRLKKVLTSV